MKKLLLMAGVLVMAACGEKKAEAPAAETTGGMAPAGEMMADSGMMHSDSMMARDSAK